MNSSENPSHRLQKLFEQVLADGYGPLPGDLSRTNPPPVGSTPVARVFTPMLDVLENTTSLIITAELPGAKKEDISLDLCRGSLTLSGKTCAPIAHDSGNVRLSERTFGSFSRTLNVPSSATPDQIKASFTDGILEIVLHKSRPDQGRQTISIVQQ